VIINCYTFSSAGTTNLQKLTAINRLFFAVN